MFTKAIVRKPGKSLVDGIGPGNLGAVDYDNALKQHAAYVEALKKVGVEVTELEPLEDFPDSCFVEDTAVLKGDMAILCNPGAASRNREPEFMVDTLRKFFKEVDEIKAPGTVEGGDVMMVGDYFYVGLSERTNEEGARQFIEILRKHGYDGEAVSLDEMLHLKTGLAYLEDNNLLVAGEFLKNPLFEKFNRVEVDESEAYGANCIWMNGYVLVPEGYPTVKEKVEGLGYKVLEVDTSEFRKLDGGLSCLSLRF